MKILKGTRIKEKGDLGYLVANIPLDGETAQEIRDTANSHFVNDSRNMPLYNSRSKFKISKYNGEGKAKYVQRRRRIILNTSGGKLRGIVLWRKSLHARAKGHKDFVRDFYDIFRDQYQKPF